MKIFNLLFISTSKAVFTNDGEYFAPRDECSLCFEEWKNPDNPIADWDYTTYLGFINPCGHPVCVRCFPEIDKCPECRGGMDGFVRYD